MRTDTGSARKSCSTTLIKIPYTTTADTTVVFCIRFVTVQNRTSYFAVKDTLQANRSQKTTSSCCTIPRASQAPKGMDSLVSSRWWYFTPEVMRRRCRSPARQRSSNLSPDGHKYFWTLKLAVNFRTNPHLIQSPCYKDHTCQHTECPTLTYNCRTRMVSHK